MPLIDEITVHHYRLPLDPPFNAAWDPRPRTHFGATLVRVRAGAYEGVGSGDAMLGFAGHEALFVGQDPFAIERHVHVLDNLQFHYGRMWPLEVALWDLMGQIAAQPLWRLLGGRGSRVPLYASTGERRPVPERVAAARALQAQGFGALKLRFHAPDPRADLAVVRAVRAAVGPEMAIMVDANQGWQMPWDTAAPWDYKTACWMADALAELDVYWLEEPLHRHDVANLARLRQRSRVRIAGGEGHRSLAELRAYLHAGALDVYQPDVVWSTGILRARQLAAEVQAASAVYSPHTWGDGLVLLANLHVAAAVAQAPYVEFPLDPPGWTPARRDFILPQPLHAAADGALQLSDAPGLGVQIDWAGLEQYAVDNSRF
ncbi:MAG: mandelate racemase/muconate lactonizing enzyme family protein [Anaerolineales bacterium]|nr:mandelate racemase/muconate lactonizing enzyme family protein [Anaerolineales bacterium]